MTCYLIRHGKDDDTVRGGWSASPLTAEGIAQVNRLANEMRNHTDISTIYTSDLVRARQTADILAKELSLPIIETPQFRETNNGVLAGMDNCVASERYPGLFWSALKWEQAYPDGESPCSFYHRIANAWNDFKQQLRGTEQNAALVTHGGVIWAIRCIEQGVQYTNKHNPFPIGYAEMIALDIES